MTKANSSSTGGGSKRLRGAKESTRASPRHNRSTEGGQHQLQHDNEQPSESEQMNKAARAEQETMATEDKKSAVAVAAKREEVAAVAPLRGRGRPRKVRSVVEASVVEASVAEAPVVEPSFVETPVAEVAAAQLQIDNDPEAGAAVSEATRESSHVDADVVESTEIQREERNADVGDSTVELDDDDARGEIKDNGGGDASDADRGAEEEKTSEPKQHEEAREESSQETTDGKFGEPTKITRKSSLVSSNASENGSTANTDRQTKSTSKSRKRPREVQQDAEAHVPRQAEPTKKTKKHKTGSKISPSSSRNLFQFTCKLLESQKLEYEVRAREFEEKNELMAAKRAKWEKKIRSVKRQLSAYGHPVDAVLDETGCGSRNGSDLNGSSALDSRYHADPLDWDMAATSTALAGTAGGFTSTSTSSGSSMSLITMRDAFSSRTSSPSGVNGSGGIDSLLPMSIQNLEAQIRDTLGARAQLVQDMMKDLQDMRGLNDKITRLR